MTWIFGSFVKEYKVGKNTIRSERMSSYFRKRRPTPHISNAPPPKKACPERKEVTIRQGETKIVVNVHWLRAFVLARDALTSVRVMCDCIPHGECVTSMHVTMQMSESSSGYNSVTYNGEERCQSILRYSVMELERSLRILEHGIGNRLECITFIATKESDDQSSDDEE